MSVSKKQQMRVGLHRSCVAFTPMMMRELKLEHQFADEPSELMRVRAAYKISAKWPMDTQLKVAFRGGSAQHHAMVEEVVRKAYWTPGGDADGFRLGLKEPEWNVPWQQANIRITFDEKAGAWSFLGTESTQQPPQNATMNIGFGWEGPAVIIHEWGHALALVHEHQNPAARGQVKWAKMNVLKEFFGAPPNNWDEKTIRTNITDILTTDEYNGSSYDPTSIMHYIFDCACFQGCTPPEGLECNCSAQGTSIAGEVCRQHCSQQPTPAQKLSAMDKQVLSEMYPWASTGPVTPVEPVVPPAECPHFFQTHGGMAVLVLLAVFVALFVVFLILYLRNKA
jgi:hypothetical protein